MIYSKRFLSGFFIVILIDQLSKYFAQQQRYVTFNEGISFGFLHQGSVWLIVVLIGILLAIWYLCRDFWKKYPLLAGLLFGGGVSNILDRFFFPGVRDWLPVPTMGLKNNLADWAIFAAVVSILYIEMLTAREKKEMAEHD
jgi:signal peptidase II